MIKKIRDQDKHIAEMREVINEQSKRFHDVERLLLDQQRRLNELEVVIRGRTSVPPPAPKSNPAVSAIVANLASLNGKPPPLVTFGPLVSGNSSDSSSSSSSNKTVLEVPIILRKGNEGKSFSECVRTRSMKRQVAADDLKRAESPTISAGLKPPDTTEDNKRRKRTPTKSTP